jgi:molybdopterin converting factor small subunit
MRIFLKLYGVFRSAARAETISLDLSLSEPTVRTVITEILSRHDSDELKKLVLDSETGDPRSNALILVSGREIGALAGLDTKLRDDDVLSLLPIAHGG